MEKAYIILSLKHSTKDEACFWRADNSGYTTNPWQAGIYTEEQVTNDRDYYNDGFNTVAICINNSSLPNSGLSLAVNEKKITDYRTKNKGQILVPSGSEV